MGDRMTTLPVVEAPSAFPLSWTLSTLPVGSQFEQRSVSGAGDSPSQAPSGGGLPFHLQRRP